MKAWKELQGAWSRRSAVRGGLDLLVQWLLFVLIVCLVRNVPDWWIYLAVAPFIGGLQHGFVNLAHEAWHGLCFKGQRLNHAVGAWLYAYPVGIPYHHDRYRHLLHHQRVGHSDDPEWVNYSNEGRTPRVRLVLLLLARLLGVQLVETAVQVIFRGKPRISVSGDHVPSPRKDFLGIVLCQALLAGAFALSGRWWEYFLLWLGPLVTFGSLYVAVRSLVEHVAERDDVDPERRLTDFNPNLVEGFFISPVNFNYHALHHAYPGVPHYRLSGLKRRLKEDGDDYPGAEGRGYLGRLAAHLGAIRPPPHREGRAEGA